MKILVAEDDATSRYILAATLRKLGHEVTAVADGVLALERWESGDFAVVISDWNMPGLSGPDLCRRIRGAPRLSYTHLILLTGLGGKGRYLEGMEAGADDFITKPFEEDQLAARLHVAHRILSLHDRLRLEATQDRMTGVWNRAAIFERLGDELARAGRPSGGDLAVILADLDHFKQVNDTLGHLAGDAVLVEAAHRMRAAVRPYDRIGRYGGEEFLVLVPSCDRDCALRVAERIRACIGGAPIDTGSGPLTITASLGVAIQSGGSRGDASELVAAADAALYRAKRTGRDRVAVADAVASLGADEPGTT